MKQIATPSFDDLSRALDNTILKLHASQAHGLLTGLLTGHSTSPSSWEEVITGSKDVGKTHLLLQTLHDTSAQQLKDFLFEFQLVLPTDKTALPERAEALSLWCQGFLTGLKVAGVNINDREPDDTLEAMEDLIEIANMNYEEVVENEEDEAAYVELVEFVRMAAILIYQDLHASKDSKGTKQASRHLH